MTQSEIRINISRIEKTIEKNFWNKGYVNNLKEELKSYKSLLTKI
jgi:hypothetical protein